MIDWSFSRFFERKDGARLALRYNKKTGSVTRTYTKLAGFEDGTTLDDVPPDHTPFDWALHLEDCILYGGWTCIGEVDPDAFASDIIEMSRVEDVFSS